MDQGRHPVASRRRPRRRRRSDSFAWQMAFEAEVWQLSDPKRAELVRRTLRWGPWPWRTFWIVDPAGGGRYLLI